jgi:hypothetical protein
MLFLNMVCLTVALDHKGVPRGLSKGEQVGRKQTTPEMALQPFQGWLARRACGLRPSSTPMDIPCHSPMTLPSGRKEKQNAGFINLIQKDYY